MCARCGLVADKVAKAKHRTDILICNRCFPKHEEAFKAQKFTISEYNPQ